MKLAVKLLRTDWPPNNGLEPGDAQFDTLLESIKKHGLHDEPPITIKSDWSVIDGCHRLFIARLLGIEYVEARVWTGTEFVQ